MGQVTIYLEDEIEHKMRSAAKSSHLSQSKWISNLIKGQVADAWPSSVAKMAGSWGDFPSTEESKKDLPPDVRREEL